MSSSDEARETQFTKGSFAALVVVVVDEVEVGVVLVEVVDVVVAVVRDELRVPSMVSTIDCDGIRVDVRGMDVGLGSVIFVRSTLWFVVALLATI